MSKDNRRSFLSKTLRIGSASILPFALSNKLELDIEATKELPSLKGRKVLFTYGGWPGHEPAKFKDYMVPWMTEEGAEVLVYDKLDPYTDESLMNTIDLVIQIMANTFTSKV